MSRIANRFAERPESGGRFRPDASSIVLPVIITASFTASAVSGRPSTTAKATWQRFEAAKETSTGIVLADWDSGAAITAETAAHATIHKDDWIKVRFIYSVRMDDTDRIGIVHSLLFK